MGQRGATGGGAGGLGAIALTVDPFTGEIIREQLNATAEKSFIAIGRDCQSPIILEVLDYSCATITDRRCDLIAQANDMSGFLVTLTFAVKACCVARQTYSLPIGLRVWRPAQPRPRLVQQDVQNGLVTIAGAHWLYGITIIPESQEVDYPATKAKRQEMVAQ